MVSLGHGCGAHSETGQDQGRDTSEEHVVLDEMKVDFIDRGEEEESAREEEREGKNDSSAAGKEAAKEADSAVS